MYYITLHNHFGNSEDKIYISYSQRYYYDL